jgi:tetratricopeptide (TPR) repeat protein
MEQIKSPLANYQRKAFYLGSGLPEAKSPRVSPGQPVAEEITLKRYIELVTTYREGEYRDSADRLVAFGLEDLSETNEEFVNALDLRRSNVNKQKQLLAAILLLTEAALLNPIPEESDFYLNEAMVLSVWLGITGMGEEKGTEFLQKLHIAAAYRLFYQRRIIDALRVLSPAAARFRSDASTQFAFGTLAEIVGWMLGSADRLQEAGSTYERALSVEPGNARAEVRLGRVLTLLGEYDTAIPHLENALVSLSDKHHRTVGLLSLGDAFRKTGRLERGVELYEEAVRLDPKCQAAFVVLSHTLRELGKNEQSESIIASSLDSSKGAASDDSWTRYLMGDSSQHAALWRELRAELQ